MEAAGPRVPSEPSHLLCSTLPRWRPHIHFTGFIATAHGDGELSLVIVGREQQERLGRVLPLKEICPRGNNKVIIYFLIS